MQSKIEFLKIKYKNKYNFLSSYLILEDGLKIVIIIDFELNRNLKKNHWSNLFIKKSYLLVVLKKIETTSKE